ncbi:unnamed protein product, partial [Fusarium fujikuroi]
MKYTFP